MNLRSKPYFPVLMTILIAGLGHVFLGYVRRGIIWFGGYVFALVGLSAYTPILFGGDVTSPFLLQLVEGEIAPTGAVFPLVVLVLCIVDVYLLHRANSRTSD